MATTKLTGVTVARHIAVILVCSRPAACNSSAAPAFFAILQTGELIPGLAASQDAEIDRHGRRPARSV